MHIENAVHIKYHYHSLLLVDNEDIFNNKLFSFYLICRQPKFDIL